MQHPSAATLRAGANVPEPLIATCLVPLLHALGSSTNTITKLAQPGLATRDCYSIARSVLECAVNLCYIMATGVTAAERAHSHAAQKAHRDLHRESQIAATTFRVASSGTLPIETEQRMQELRTEFEWSNGREKSWIDLSIDQRIDAVYSRFGRPIGDRLHVARFALYRHSSEILHGTLFGAHFFLGLSTTTARGAAEVTDNIAWTHMTVQASLFQAIAGVVEAFDAAYGFPEAKTQVQNLHALIHRLPGMSTPSRE